ncbi:unnamed protein product [Cuscuta campestris]|uniref:Retrotransposon Copia-like N-terminal domain-containing protein n=1 Tax=Cuscuta campestris TaxID=132261 RepID=A0A484LLK7_9ASTE|nr:unnamed protein product [Cuscuta campestris]
MAQPSDLLASLPSSVKLLLRNLHNLISEKLTDSNYPAWSLNVKTALEANLLLGCIDGHEAAPPKILSKDGKENPNPEFQTRTVIDTQIRACLIAVISPSVHKHVRNFTTSADLWNTLAARYNSVSTAHNYQLRDKLHTLRKGKKTITQYLDEVATILTDLDALNEVILDRDVVNAVIRAVEAAVEEDRTVDHFLGEDLDPVAAVKTTEEGEAADRHAIFQYVRSVQSVATLLLPAGTAMMILLLRVTRLPILVLCMQPQATKLIVDNDTNLVRYTGPCEHGLYTLPSKPIPVVRQAITASTWHRRLGHPAPAVAKSILSTLGFGRYSASPPTRDSRRPEASAFCVLIRIESSLCDSAFFLLR